MKSSRKPNSMVSKHGMALLAVLWAVAALSLVVMGLTKSLKAEVQQVSADKSSVQLSALGDAAILTVLKQLVASKTAERALPWTGQLTVLGRKVWVEVMPLNGLIDINSAPVTLLADLLQHGANVPAGQAEELAQAIVAVRSRDGGTGRPEGFEAIEDLLRVPGIDRRIYIRLAGLVTVFGGGSGKVNPLAAPNGVLLVLAKGNQAAADSIALRRQGVSDANFSQIDTTMLTPAHVAVAAFGTLKLTCRMPLDDTRTFFRTWTLKLVNPEAGVLPWQKLDVTRGVESTVVSGATL